MQVRQVFDPDTEFTVAAEGLHFRHPVTPYAGARLRGVVKATYLRGERVWNEGAFDSRARGRELRLC